MKKFITISPYQSEVSLKKGVYKAADNQRLCFDGETRFPIIPVINGYVFEKGEEIEIIVVIAEYDNAKKNYEFLKEEVEELSLKKGFTYTFKELRIPYNNELDTELDLFSMLLDCINDDDTLFTCITYGSKPFPIMLFMALNYGHRIKKNVCVECIVYGARDHVDDKMAIYDVTPLLYIDESIRILAEQKISNPTQIIKNLIKR